MLSSYGLTLKAQQVSLLSPQTPAQFTLPVSVPLEAAVTGVTYPEPAYLLVQSNQTGYRKLKLGYSPTNIYSPYQNVTAGGNVQLEITMKLISGVADWTKILVKPMGLGSLALQPYVTAAGGLGNNWKTITVPLADFSTSINFTQVSNIEFPYSTDAPPFEIAISCMKFTGGTTPFTWFGEGKTDNKHNGNGGGGELVANLVQAGQPVVYPQKVEFYAGTTKISEVANPPYQYSWSTPLQGSYQVKARLIMSDGTFSDSPAGQVTILPNPGPAFSVVLSQPPAGDTLAPPGSLQLAATVTGLFLLIPANMLVTNSMTGYRKLKFGFSPTSLYSPLLNVIAGGNNILEITLRDVTGSADWSKIQVRPVGLGSLCLQSYVNAVGGVDQNWKTITIPLADFTSTINFAALANLEFPYSISAPNFQVAIKSIRFIGGTTPFVWFGFGKTDNKQNGTGGGGELIASLDPGNQSGDYIEKIEFYSGNNKLGEAVNPPYTFQVNGLAQGNYSLTAKVISHGGQSAASPAVNLVVYQPPVITSPMSVNITSPVSGTSYITPLNMPVNVAISGAIAPGPDYLRVTNTLTGYVKLKLGYSPTTIYTPTQNVITGGNDTIELVLRNEGGPIDWSKIRIRPAGKGILNLGSYAAAVGGIGNEWRTIRIPLSVFDSTINFASLGYFEFPYSAGANNFQVGIQSIRFTGGAAPFTWFGNGKTNNANDGNGGTGQLTASVVSPNAIAVDASKVQLFDNDVMVGQDLQPPWQLTLSNPQPGLHHIRVKMIDTRNAVAFSDTIHLAVLSSVPEGNLLVTVHFDQAPASVVVNKAPLRYDKDFAYSLSFDDALIDAYSCAFKLLAGGYSSQTMASYPGLHYTDGCGHDIPFAASTVWNSANSAFADIHVNTPSYISWTQLNEMLDSNWAVINHSFSHAYGTGTNYAWQISANDSAVFSHTGIHLNHFASPSGDAGYYPLAYEMGYVCSYSRNSLLGKPYGLKIDSPLNYQQFKIFRDMKSDDLYSPQTIIQPLDQCASLAQNGNHYWYNDFTHHVSPVPVNGNLLFSTFQTYMEHAAQLFGKNGSDRIWMAPGVEVFEYLKLRDACPVSYSLYGNDLRILVNRDSMPGNLLQYAMSFVIDAGANITSVELNENAAMSYRGNTSRKLINLEWQPQAMQNLQHGNGAGSGENLSRSINGRQGSIRQVGNSHVVLISLPVNEAKGCITVFDIHGLKVCSLNHEGNTANRNFRVNLPALKSGLYLVQYCGEDGYVQTGKLFYPQCK